MNRTFTMLGGLVLAFTSISAFGPTAQAGPLLASSAPATGVTCGKPNDQGLIVFLDVADTQAIPEASTVSATLVVYTPGGTVVHRVPLSDFPTFFPLGVGCAILGNAPALGSFLFDPVSGTLRRLALPADYDGNLVPLTGWQRTFREHRYAFVTDNPATHALLLDTDTGTVTDLAALVRTLRGDDSQLVVVLRTALSPDESSFLLITDRDAWLVPTADPARARQLPNALPAPVSYSDDGKQILFAAKTGDQTSDVIVEYLDGTGRQVLASGGQHTSAFWVPGTDGQSILIARSDRSESSISLLTNGRESMLAILPAGTVLLPPMFSPSNRRALVQTRADTTAWLWIDLETGIAHPLHALAGYPLPFAPDAPGVRWLEFFPSDTATVQPGTSILGLDLETGHVSTLLTFDFEEPYAGILPYSTYGSSPDGRYVAVNDLGRQYPRFWLLDAAEGTATLHDGRLAGSFSPDGRSLVVSERAGGTDGRLWRTLIMSVAGQDISILAVSLGRGGLWVPGTHAR